VELLMLGNGWGDHHKRNDAGQYRFHDPAPREEAEVIRNEGRAAQQSYGGQDKYCEVAHLTASRLRRTLPGWGCASLTSSGKFNHFRSYVLVYPGVPIGGKADMALTCQYVR
jgi:hypothetical protein